MTMTHDILVPTHPECIHPLLGRHVAGLGADRANWLATIHRVFNNLIHIREFNQRFI